MKKLFTFFALLILTLSANANPIDVQFNDGIYHITLSGEKVKKQIQFISSSNLITNKEAHVKSGSLLTINTGFFDPKN